MELVITHLDGQMLRSMNLAAQVRSEGQLLSMASVPLLTHSLSLPLLPRTQEHLQRDGGALRRRARAFEGRGCPTPATLPCAAVGSVSFIPGRSRVAA